VRVPQQARSRRTRDAVLQAATRCFERAGYDETTTAMIAREAGIAVGTLYGYFRDKREILIELMDSTFREVARLVVERLDPEALAEADPRKVARELIETVFHTQTLRPGLQRIVWERHFKDDAFRERIEAIRARMRAAIRRFLEEMARRGLLRELDAESAAAVVLHAVSWNAAHAFLYGTPEWIERVSRSTADMVSRYLFVD
jgi:AcrR family transcriptional regulator